MTKEITTPAGHKFILNDFITYGQHRELTCIYISKKDDVEKSSEADKLGIEFVVQSIDDNNKDIYKTFMSLPYNDLTGVLAEIKAIISPKV